MTKKISTTKHIIIFDIDSTSVGGGLFRYSYSEKNELLETRTLYSLRKNITHGNEYPFDQFFNKTLTTLRSVAEEVYVQSLIPLDDIYCNTGTPWMNSYKKRITYKKDKPFTITQELIEGIIEKELQQKPTKGRVHKHHDLTNIDSHILSRYGNGYKLRGIHNQEVSDVAIEFLTNAMSTTTIQNFSHIIEKVFHREPKYISNTLVSYRYAQKLFPNINSTFIIDISGEVTEVLVVCKDNLEHIGSIPIGENAVLRSLRDTLGVTIAEAKNLLILHYGEKLDADYSHNLNDALHQSFRIWFKEFFNLCDTYAKKGLLPSHIILRSDTTVRNWFAYMILQEDILKEHIYSSGNIELQHMHSQEVIDGDIELLVVAEFVATENLPIAIL